MKCLIISKRAFLGPGNSPDEVALVVFARLSLMGGTVERAHPTEFTKLPAQC